MTFDAILLNDVLDKHNAPKIIDYFSLDVEGAEGVVLKELFASRLGREMKGLVIELSQEYHSAAEIGALDETIRAAGLEEVARRGKASHYDAHYRRKDAP